MTTTLIPPRIHRTGQVIPSSTALRLRTDLALLGVIVLDLALLVTLLLPWRHVSITTSSSSDPHILSLNTTQQAIDAVHRALVIQSVLRAVVELLTLMVAGAIVVCAARCWYRGQRGRRSTLLTLGALSVLLSGLACFALPLINDSAGLTVHVVMNSSGAAYLAFGMSVASLVLIGTACLGRQVSDPLVPA